MAGVSSLGYAANAYAGRVGAGQPMRRLLHTLAGHGPRAHDVGMAGYGGMALASYGWAPSASYSVPSYSAISYPVEVRYVYVYPAKASAWPSGASMPKATADPFGDDWKAPAQSNDRLGATQADLRAIEDRMNARMDRLENAIRALAPLQAPEPRPGKTAPKIEESVLPDNAGPSKDTVILHAKKVLPAEENNQRAQLTPLGKRFRKMFPNHSDQQMIAAAGGAEKVFVVVPVAFRVQSVVIAKGK